VLRLVSALPGITVTHGTVDGQPTLTLTAGAAELGFTGTDKANPKAASGPAYQEAITINADTGIPLGLTGGPAGGKVAGSVTYRPARVVPWGVRALLPCGGPATERRRARRPSRSGRSAGSPAHDRRA